MESPRSRQAPSGRMATSLADHKGLDRGNIPGIHLTKLLPKPIESSKDRGTAQESRPSSFKVVPPNLTAGHAWKSTRGSQRKLGVHPCQETLTIATEPLRGTVEAIL